MRTEQSTGATSSTFSRALRNFGLDPITPEVIGWLLVSRTLGASILGSTFPSLRFLRSLVESIRAPQEAHLCHWARSNGSSACFAICYTGSWQARGSGASDGPLMRTTCLLVATLVERAMHF